MSRKRSKSTPPLTRDEVADIRVSLSAIRHSIESFQSLSAHLDHITRDVAELDRHMLAALARIDKANPPPKEKKPKYCKKDKHQWFNVGTRTDSPMRCRNCPMWYAEYEEKRG